MSKTHNYLSMTMHTRVSWNKVTNPRAFLKHLLQDNCIITISHSQKAVNFLFLNILSMLFSKNDFVIF